MSFSGEVVAAFGLQHGVRLIEDGSLLACVTRGKKTDVVCGDRVTVKQTGPGQGVIEQILPRSALLYRSDAFRQKRIAANVSQLIIVVATEPSFSDELLARSLVAAQHEQLKVLIVLNKCDLQAAAEPARARLAVYRTLGYEVLELSAVQDASALRPYLQGQRSVLLGQSGMGKSTLINALLPDAQAATREISAVLDSGKHTTTHAKLYHLDADSSLIDCPGVQAFGLHHLTFGEIELGFVEFAPYLGQCRFANCRHDQEPGCALRQAAQSGAVDARRFELFRQIVTVRA